MELYIYWAYVTLKASLAQWLPWFTLNLLSWVQIPSRADF